MLNRFRHTLARLIRQPGDANLVSAIRQNRRMVENLGAAHHATATTLEALGSAHHATFVRLGEAEATLGRMQQDMAALSQHLPVILNAITTHNHEARVLAEVRDAQAATAATLATVQADVYDKLRMFAEGHAYLERRVEFVRREVMYEVRLADRGAGAPAKAATIVRDPAVFSRRPLRVNLGAGHIQPDGYVQVDGRDLDGIDVVADLRSLPFETDSVDEILSAHVIEHFTAEDFLGVLLPHWVGLLRPGGILRLVAPDTDAMVRAYLAGTRSFEQLRLVTFGGQEYEGDFHLNMFTAEAVVDACRAAGLTDVTVAVAGRENGDCFEFEVSGTKPKGGS